jgi:hypothetical protein
MHVLHGLQNYMFGYTSHMKYIDKLNAHEDYQQDIVDSSRVGFVSIFVRGSNLLHRWFDLIIHQIANLYAHIEELVFVLSQKLVVLKVFHRRIQHQVLHLIQEFLLFLQKQDVKKIYFGCIGDVCNDPHVPFRHKKEHEFEDLSKHKHNIYFP